MTGYVVTAPAAVLKTSDGSERYLYRGAPFDGEAFDKESVKHALAVGLVDKAKVVETETETETVVIPEGDPVEAWSGKQLDAYAKRGGFDLGSASTKADKVEAIVAAQKVAADAAAQNPGE